MKLLRVDRILSRRDAETRRRRGCGEGRSSECDHAKTQGRKACRGEGAMQVYAGEYLS